MKTVLTSEGKRKLKEELVFLSTVEKSRLINELADARDRGGVAENSEYEVALEEYNRLQSKIVQLEDTINKSVIVSKVDSDFVSILSTVKVLNRTRGGEIVFKIVPENEIDIKSGKISLNSPIGSGLLNKKVGEISKIETPGGVIEFEILSIS